MGVVIQEYTDGRCRVCFPPKPILDLRTTGEGLNDARERDGEQPEDAGGSRLLLLNCVVGGLYDDDNFCGMVSDDVCGPQLFFKN